jgi:homoserine O-succinyltransferase
LLGKWDNDCREGEDPSGRIRSRTENLARYTPYSEIDFPVGILILTGDNEEIEPYPEGLSSRKPQPKELDKIDYADRLYDLVKMSEQNARITILSCLSSHFVLNYFHDLPKQTMDQKIFGVYEHNVVDDPLTRGLGQTIWSPHSRFGNVSLDQIEARNARLKEARRLKVLAASPEVGFLAIKEVLPNGHIRIYLQGHPEYDTNDLKGEYERDLAKFGVAQLPANYFPDDDPSRSPRNIWAPGARVFNHNTLNESQRLLLHQ